MACLEHQKTHYSNPLVSKPPVQSIIILSDESVFAQAHSYWGFQKTPKEQSWTTTTKRIPPQKLTIESCIKSYDLVFVFSLSFFDYTELLNRAARYEKYRTISPGSSHTEF